MMPQADTACSLNQGEGLRNLAPVCPRVSVAHLCLGLARVQGHSRKGEELMSHYLLVVTNTFATSGSLCLVAACSLHVALEG